MQMRSLGLSVAVLIVALPAIARDRPGTPTDVVVYATTFEDQLPSVMVHFRNTATERVSFWVEWTENGVRQTNDLTKLPPGMIFGCPAGTSAECLEPSNFLSSRRNYVDMRSASSRTPRTFPYGFTISNIAYDSEYCFRFKAVDDSNVVSEIWSAMTCSRTAAPPAIPQAPRRVQVTYQVAQSDRGRVGPGHPAQALLEWDALALANFAGFEVDRYDEYRKRWIVPQHDKLQRLNLSLRPTLGETVVELGPDFDPAKAPPLRLCAVNVSGRACTVAKPEIFFLDARRNEKSTAAAEAARQPAPPPATVLSAAGPATTRASRTSTAEASESTASNSRAHSTAMRSTRSAESVRPSTRPNAAEVKAQIKKAEEESDRSGFEEFVGGLVGEDSGRAEPIPHNTPLTAGRITRQVKVNEIICRGGSTYAMALIQRGNDEDLNLMYFIASDASASGDKSSLDIGRCAILDGSFVDGRAGSVQFKSKPGTGEGSAASIAESLASPENYWRFVIKKDPATGALQAVSQQPM